jgi:ubiquitin-conjugating enzyme (huntingtin interacting protein 2)
MTNAHDAAVAKHYLSDRASFNATAKHWAQAYAQAPAHKQKPVAGKVATDAELAGLSEAHVAAFTDMGFPRDKVVRRCGTHPGHVALSRGMGGRVCVRQG